MTMEAYRPNAVITHPQVRRKQNWLYLFLLHFCIIEIIVFSGEQRFTSMLGNRFRLPLFLLSGILLYIFSTRKLFLPRRNLIIATILIVWIFSCCFVFNFYSSDFTWASFVILPLGTCFIVSSCNFNEFRNLLLRYLTILSVVSIIVQIGHDYFHIFPAHNYYIDGHDRFLSLGYFTTEWGRNRLASIYWEPGQYQIVINFVLCLFIDELSDFAHLGKLFRKFGVLFLALFMTISTAGYIAFAIIMFTAMLNARLSRRLIFYYLFALVVVLVTANFMYNSRAIQDKLEQREYYGEKSSYTIRYDDNMALLRCTLEKPVIGYGIASPTLKNRLYDYGSQTSSNGWLYASAQLGLVYVILICICMFLNIRKMYETRVPLLILLALVVSQANEYTIVFPYVHMYVYSFRSYAFRRKKRRILYSQSENTQLSPSPSACEPTASE